MFTNAITDEQLVEWYLRGDETALRTLFERHLTPVYAFVRRYVGDDDDAKDVTQETLMRAWRHLRTFDQTKRFKTWLFTIAKNTSLNFLRKKKPAAFSELARGSEANESTFEDLLEDPAPSLEELFDAVRTAEELGGAIAELPPPHRMVLLLYYQDQFTLQEIAEIIGEPLNTVKSRHRRALLALRKLLVP
ncbi:MAG: RNA polymerase sigma factor [Candidatus Jorgensenbacteria bacterium]